MLYLSEHRRLVQALVWVTAFLFAAGNAFPRGCECAAECCTPATQCVVPADSACDCCPFPTQCAKANFGSLASIAGVGGSSQWTVGCKCHIDCLCCQPQERTPAIARKRLASFEEESAEAQFQLSPNTTAFARAAVPQRGNLNVAVCVVSAVQRCALLSRFLL